MEYEYMYYDTLKLDHVDPKQPIVIENDSLDFSFCDLQDVISLKSKDPRSGKRIPPQNSENEEEEK